MFRTIRRYRVNVGAWVKVSNTRKELQVSDIFIADFVGKPTETDVRKAGKAQGIKCGKGYAVDFEEIGTIKYEMDDNLFMQLATPTEWTGECEPVEIEED